LILAAVVVVDGGDKTTPVASDGHRRTHCALPTVCCSPPTTMFAKTTRHTCVKGHLVACRTRTNKNASTLTHDSCAIHVAH
jgi:hypothetical protein